MSESLLHPLRNSCSRPCKFRNLRRSCASWASSTHDLASLFSVDPGCLIRRVQIRMRLSVPPLISRQSFVVKGRADPVVATGPAFFDAIPGAITEITDRSWGMERTEIVCSKCGGHQGHVFRNEGFREFASFLALFPSARY